jgi:Zn-dependent M28 family amino/carboxypeptidase
MKKTFPILGLLLFLIVFLLNACQSSKKLEFSGDNAFLFAKTQLDFGPRTPGSLAHDNTVDWIQSVLLENNWETEIQSEDITIHKIENIIAKRKNNDGPWIIIAAHYDSRFYADQDSQIENRKTPVPGANDGASGVAVLLELSRVLPDTLNKNVWLVFFDAEDQGNIDSWDWILGSKSFANQLDKMPEEFVLLDMIGDKDLNIFYERNSDIQLRSEIWEIAAKLGYDNVFIPKIKYNMLDDHIPFVEKGVAAIDIIDFDYPHWHTTQDVLENISSESLQIVGNTIFHWLLLP